MRLYCAESLMYKIAPSTTSMFLFLGFFLYVLKDIRVLWLINAYRLIAYTNIIFFLIQELVYLLLNYRLKGILTFIPSTLTDDLSVLEHAERFSAFFSEPSHFAQFLLPLLAIELFYFTNRSYWRIIVLLLMIAFLKSGTAVVGLLVVILFAYYSFIQKKKAIYTMLLLPVVTLTLAFSFIAVSKTEFGMEMMERQEELDSESEKVSSGFIRIFRGYFVFDELTPVQKILGLNDKSELINAVNRSSVALMFKDNELYFNGIQGFLINTGVLGTMLFVGFVLWLWHGNNLAGRCILLMLCSLFFVASLFFTHTMLLYLVISFIFKYQRSQCQNSVVILKLSK